MSQERTIERCRVIGEEKDLEKLERCAATHARLVKYLTEACNILERETGNNQVCSDWRALLDRAGSPRS